MDFSSNLGKKRSNSELLQAFSTTDIIGGVLLVLAGLYMLNAYFFFMPELAG